MLLNILQALFFTAKLIKPKLDPTYKATNCTDSTACGSLSTNRNVNGPLSGNRFFTIFGNGKICLEQTQSLRQTDKTRISRHMQNGQGQHFLSQTKHAGFYFDNWGQRRRGAAF